MDRESRALESLVESKFGYRSASSRGAMRWDMRIASLLETGYVYLEYMLMEETVTLGPFTTRRQPGLQEVPKKSPKVRLAENLTNVSQ